MKVQDISLYDVPFLYEHEKCRKKTVARIKGHTSLLLYNLVSEIYRNSQERFLYLIIEGIPTPGNVFSLLFNY